MANKGGFVTVLNTQYLYPPADIERAFAATTISVERIGSVWIFANTADFVEFIYDVFYQTTLSQPVGNIGFTLGVGTYLEDMGQEVHMKLATGEALQTWRLVRQITPQEPVHVIPTPGNSPAGTIGYSTIATSWASTDPLNFYNDVVLLVRV